MTHLETPYPYNQIAFKAALATGIGLLVGLEREWAQKEIGVRTFALCGLLGMLTSLVAPAYTLSGLAGILLLVAFLNVHSLLRDRSLEMTTSLCLIVVYFLGAMVGLDHYFTAATSGIIVMMLLAWKLELQRFAGALRPEEIRSAVLLGLLSVVVFPLLPNRFIDPWQLFNPQQFWVTVVVIAGIGFLNYVLMRLYSNRGLYYAAVLGGLVNSTAAVAELATQLRSSRSQPSRSVAILLLTNMSMFVRNGVILAIFAFPAAQRAAVPLGAMALATAVFARMRVGRDPAPAEPLNLTSPVSLVRVGKFSVLFLVLAVSGALAQRFLGAGGFLLVSIAGGLISSASTTATAAALVAAHMINPLNGISPETGAIATVFTSLSSALVNMPLVYQQTRQRELTRQLTIATAVIAGIGLFVLGVSEIVAPGLASTPVAQSTN